LQRPLSNFVQCAFELGASIPAIGKDMAQPREGIADRVKNGGSAISRTSSAISRLSS
jgi:hypothetical protein